MVITKDCLTKLILNCGKYGYSHKRIHTEFMPDETVLTLDKKNAILEGKIKDDAQLEKTLRKISTAYEQRKFLSAHLFEKGDGDEWHIIYFDHNDIYIPKDQNHYRFGPHMHYISFLWGRNLNKDQLWQQVVVSLPRETVGLITERLCRNTLSSQE